MGSKKKSEKTGKNGATGRRDVSGGDDLSPRGLIEANLANPLPADEASASACPVPPGTTLLVIEALLASAYGAFVLALKAGKQLSRAVREEAARLLKAARSAKKELGLLEQELEGAIERRALYLRLLGGRLHRTRVSRRKAWLLMVGVVAGEVALNSGAAIYSGDNVLLAILSFLGIGAATAGVGWLGAVIRHGFDRARHPGEMPQEAEGAGLERFYAASWKAWLACVSGVVIVVTAALGLGIGALRMASGSYSLYGLFTAVTVIGAAAITFCAEDEVADLLESSDARIATLNQERDAQAGIIGSWRKARASRRQIEAEQDEHAKAQWHLTRSTGLFALCRQSHIVGHFLAAGAIPITPEEYIEGSWREKAIAVSESESKLRLIDEDDDDDTMEAGA